MKPIVRLLLNLTVEEKKWLEELAEISRNSQVGLVRKALDLFQETYFPDFPERPGKNEKT